MTFWLPPAYEDELLCGVLERAARRSAMKLRLTALLALGQATACHSQFPKQVPRFCVNMRLDPSEGKRLVREHTSYPLIAPFLTPENRIRLLCWMLDDCRRLGRPGSRIFTGTHYKTYRFCPRCFEEQEARSGERYWRRMWQYPQLAVCPVHGTPLWDTQEPFQGISGSTRVISPYAVNCAVQLAPGPHDGEVLAALNDLLGEPLPLPSPEQWKQAYEALCRGRTHDEIDEAALRYWGSRWMEANHIRRTTDLLRGRYFHAWWMHLTLIKALNPTMGMGDLIRFAVSN